MDKRIVIVAYHAPPSNATGTFRTLGFIRYLSDMGWQITLITVKVPGRDLKDNELLQKMPPSVRVIRAGDWDCFAPWGKVRKWKPAAGAPYGETGRQNVPTTSSAQGWWHTVKELLTTFLKTPDQQIGWFWPTVIRCVTVAKPAIVYSSAPPFTAHLIGLFCKYFWRVPLVCDFRDPWIDNPFRREKLPLVDQWDKWLERLVLSRADLIVANTEKVASVFRQKISRPFPEIISIPNGYDPGDFLGIEPVRDYPANQLLLVHAGMLYGERNPMNFLKALFSLTKQNACPHLQVLLIGASALVEGRPLEQCIAEMGLTSCVRTQPPVSHAIALSLMKGADALLLLALGTTSQVPAKLFEYLGLEKPVLSIAEPASATEEITSQLPEIIYAAHNEPESIQEALRVLYKAWEGGVLRAGLGGGEPARSLLRPMQRQYQAGVLEGYMCTLTNQEKG